MRPNLMDVLAYDSSSRKPRIIVQTGRFATAKQLDEIKPSEEEVMKQRTDFEYAPATRVGTFLPTVSLFFNSQRASSARAGRK
ncbi:unnamed protein product [Caenorhabditis auriculariae]|uniref:Uncharacterized protein n=1 Tax=Caenorhabditis auriculariae TaxID=2777116 RepID=A0A8S1HFH1_9PELO|nr:unnamed protein product [Caenorhabditis auriculariae]